MPLKQPVFVIGPPRCGTSLLCHALKGVGGYDGLAEGNLFSLVAPMMEVVGRHYRIVQRVMDRSTQMVSRFPQDRMEQLVLDLFRPLAADVFGGRNWLDKTPGPAMILSAPYLKKIWPGSFFVFAHRRGIENVVSQQHKFAGWPFDFSCRHWADCMSAWQQVRSQLDGSHYMVDQLDLQEVPDQVARELGQAIGLSPEACERMARVFAKARPEDTGGKSRTRLSLETCGWTPEQQQVYLTHCAEMSAAYGYTNDETYRSPAAASRA